MLQNSSWYFVKTPLRTRVAATTATLFSVGSQIESFQAQSCHFGFVSTNEYDLASYCTFFQLHPLFSLSNLNTPLLEYKTCLDLHARLVYLVLSSNFS